MEELIWKYIDSNCTKEEVEKVKTLLETDPDFSNLYSQISGLDKLLSASVNEPMSADFKLKLENTIVSNTINVQQLKIFDILSIQWIAALSIVAVGVIVYVTTFNTEVSSFIPDLPLPDEKVMNMVSLVTTGFVMLLLLDWVLKAIHNKKISFFLA